MEAAGALFRAVPGLAVFSLVVLASTFALRKIHGRHGGRTRHKERSHLLLVPEGEGSSVDYRLDGEVISLALSLLHNAAGHAEVADAAKQPAFTFVESADDLKRAATALAQSSIIGCDIEHSPKSFHGFVCIIQLSTANDDFIVDCLVPDVRKAIPQLLGPIFSSKRAIKVFHAASNDVRWLSSNFGIRVNGLLDTALLAKALNGVATSRRGNDHSLAALLRDYLGVVTDKRFQKSDWTLRPLPTEMINYARTDSRYLPQLASSLLTLSVVEQREDALRNCLRLSHSLAQQRYNRVEKETFQCTSFVEWIRNRFSLTPFKRCPSAAVQEPLEARVRLLFVLCAHLRHLHALRYDYNPEHLMDRAALAALIARLCSAREAFVADEEFDAVSVDWPSDMKSAFSSLCRRILEAPGSEVAALAYLLAAGRLSSDLFGNIVVAPSDPAARPEGSERAGSVALPAPCAVSANDVREARKAARSQRLFAPRATPLYNNISLVSPSGLLLARIDTKKALWYAQVGLVDILDHDGCVRNDIPGLPPQLLEGSIQIGEPTFSVQRSCRDEPPTRLAGHLSIGTKKRRQFTCGGDGKNGVACIHLKPEHSGIASTAELSPVSASPELEAFFKGYLQNAAKKGASLTLRMRREPRGVGHNGDSFHLNEKANECVVCGLSWAESGGLSRTYIVPHTFRSLMPLAAKSFSCHDIILTDARCHRLVDIATASMVKALLAEFDLPSSVRDAHAQGLTITDSAEPSARRSSGHDASSSGLVGTAQEMTVPMMTNLLHKLLTTLKKDVGLVLRSRKGDVLGDDGSASAASSAVVVGKAGFFIAGLSAGIASESAPGVDLHLPASAVGVTLPPASALEAFMRFRMQGPSRRRLTELATLLVDARDVVDSPPLINRADYGCRDHHELRRKLMELLQELVFCRPGADLGKDRHLLPASDDVAVCNAGLAFDLMLGLPGGPRYEPAYWIISSTLEGNERWRRAESFGHFPPLRGTMLPVPDLKAATDIELVRAWLLRNGHSLGDGSSAAGVAAACASIPLPESLADVIPGASGLPLSAEYRLARFIHRWRDNFVNMTRPTALPTGWSVTYKTIQGGLRTDGNRETPLAETLRKKMWVGSS